MTCGRCRLFPIADDGSEFIDGGLRGDSERSEAEFCLVVDVDVRWSCFTGNGIGLSFIPPHVADDDTCQARGKGEDHADVVAGSDMLWWCAHGGCDDHNKQRRDDDNRSMKENGQGDEAHVPHEEGLLIVFFYNWLLLWLRSDTSLSRPSLKQKRCLGMFRELSL